MISGIGFSVLTSFISVVVDLPRDCNAAVSEVEIVDGFRLKSGSFGREGLGTGFPGFQTVVTVVFVRTGCIGRRVLGTVKVSDEVCFRADAEEVG